MNLDHQNTFVLCCKSGVPPGVVNMVFGTGPRAGQALVSHPKVGIISFTGGTATAAKIQQAALPYFKKLSLEVSGQISLEHIR